VKALRRLAVLSAPPSVQKVEVPAEYKKVKVRKLVAPAQEKRIAVPEEKQTVSKRVKLSDEKLEWRQVLCETNMSRDLITRVQRSGNSAGCREVSNRQRFASRWFDNGNAEVTGRLDLKSETLSVECRARL